jgi:hypothetical protein
MNFNFNFKDMPGAPGASIRCVTNVRDRHHTAKYGIKRSWWGEASLRNGDLGTATYPRPSLG